MARKHNEWKAAVKEKYPNAKFRPGPVNDVAYIIEDGKEFAVGKYNTTTDESHVLSDEAFRDRHKNKGKTGASLFITYASATRRMETAELKQFLADAIMALKKSGIVKSAKFDHKKYWNSRSPGAVSRNYDFIFKAVLHSPLKETKTIGDVEDLHKKLGGDKYVNKILRSAATNLDIAPHSLMTMYLGKEGMGIRVIDLRD